MNSEYYQSLSQRILSVLKSQPLELCDIIKASQGAYPEDVVISLNKLIKDKLVFIDNSIYRVVNFNYAVKRPVNDKKVISNDLSWIKQITAKLSKPHPADYDWRFTDQTINDLSRFVADNENYTSIALFGTTTLFPIIKQIRPDIKLSLFNKSQSLIRDVENMGFVDGLYLQDLFSVIPYPTKYSLVIADPPWYNDFYNAFIRRASEVLDVGGYLYLSVLPLFTRPDADKDRVFIDKRCEENGFEKIESIDGFLNYESPVFEIRSLTSSEIKCSDWRKGDLVIYKKKSNVAFLDVISAPVDEPLWDEYEVNGVKLKLLKNDDNSTQFSFESSDTTNVLSTVSRRSPVRQRINFWTSENYAFKVSKLKVLRYLFRFVKSGNSLELALTKTKIDENLTEVEFKSLVDLLKIANITNSG